MSRATDIQAQGNHNCDDDDDDDDIILFKPTRVTAAQSVAAPLKGNVEQLTTSLEKVTLKAIPVENPILVIFDLNGILVWRELIIGSSRAKPLNKKYRVVKQFRVWDRPNLQSFLNFVFDNFTVAIWSSTRRDNLLPIVEDILGDERLKQLLFLWDQSDCTVETRVDSSYPLFLKDLGKVWKKFPQFANGRTLLIDDDEPKAKLNPPSTGIHPKTWNTLTEGDTCLSPKGSLSQYLGALRGQLTDLPQMKVEEFVRSHPYSE